VSKKTLGRSVICFPKTADAPMPEESIYNLGHSSSTTDEAVPVQV
jgi:hypothetical protein